MLDQVVRRTNILAGISALVISILAWAGGPLIIATLTSQADLAAMTLAHWHWVALLAPVAFMAFQMDGIFIGAAGGYGLNGLLAAFTIYLGLRGITLMMRMRHVRAMAMPDDNTARNDTT